MGPNESDSIKNRIRRAIDSANPAEVAFLMSEAASSNLPVPISIVSVFCSGSAFVEKYSPYVAVNEQNGRLFIDFEQFRAVHGAILSDASCRKLKNVSDKYNNTSKLSYSDGRITIRRRKIKPSNGQARYASQFTFRVMIQGKEYFFPVGLNGHKGLNRARKIQKDVRKGTPIVDLLRSYHPNSSLLKQLIADGEPAPLPMNTSAPGASVPPLVTIPQSGKPLATVGDVTQLLKDNASALGLGESSVSGYVNQLYKILICGLPKYQGSKQYSSPPKPLLDEPVTILTSGVVMEFRRFLLDQFKDKAERRSKASGLNSTLTQAKALFSKDAMNLYGESPYHVPYPDSFMAVSKLRGTKKVYRLPKHDTMEGLFEDLSRIREERSDIYICLLLALFVGLRQGEIANLPCHAIRKSDRWRVHVTDQPNFTVKDYEERDIPIPEALALHLREVANAADASGKVRGGYLLPGHKTYRDENLRDDVNAYLRTQGLSKIRLPTHELRKWCATVLAYSYNPFIAQLRLGHADIKTTKDSYIDDRMTKKTANLWPEYARVLFGGDAFVDKD
jgi:integrase